MTTAISPPAGLVELPTEEELFDRAQDGDERAREALVRQYLPLAKHQARKLFSAAAEREDLVQVASYGLVKAIDRYDPSRGVSFTSFAVPTISGELKRYIRDTGWGLHVPRGLQEDSMAVERAVAQLEPELGRSPSISEIADAAGLTNEEVLEALDVARTRSVEGFEQRPDDEEGGGGWEARLGSEDSAYELVDELVSLSPRLRRLPSRERRLIELRFGREMSQSEIARELGISQMHVSRLLRRTLEKLGADPG